MTVEPDLTLAGHPEVMALGDMVRVKAAGRRHPGPPGRRAGGDAAGPLRRRVVKRRLAGKPVKPFHYIDKGNLATIGRARAVAEIKGLHFGGPLAWLLWLGIHIFYLIGFQNRILVLTRWALLLPDPRARRAPAHGRRGRGWAGVPGGGVRTPGVEVAGLKRGPGGANIAP